VGWGNVGWRIISKEKKKNASGLHTYENGQSLKHW
jgi:hypothetical protein